MHSREQLPQVMNQKRKAGGRVTGEFRSLSMSAMLSTNWIGCISRGKDNAIEDDRSLAIGI